jgi:hypothetical protein
MIVKFDNVEKAQSFSNTAAQKEINAVRHHRRQPLLPGHSRHSYVSDPTLVIEAGMEAVSGVDGVLRSFNLPNGLAV